MNRNCFNHQGEILRLAIGIVLSAAFVQAHAQSPQPPAGAASAPPFQLAQPPMTAQKQQKPKLRLNVTFNETGAGGSAKIAGLAVCSPSTCVNVPVPASVPITNTMDGRSATIAEVESSISEITSIQFKAAGQGTLQGTVALPAALKLSADFVGGDILVVAQRRGATFEPMAAASNNIPREGTSVYYNPKFATNVTLPLGVKLQLPANALSAPQVFTAGVHDTGEALPLVDLFPALSLAKPAYLELTPIARAAPGPNDPPPVTRLPLPGSVEPAPVSGPVKMRIDATGVVRPGSRRSGADGTEQGPLAASTDGCLALMTEANVGAAAAILNQTGSVYVDWCVNTPPYVHMAATAMSDPRQRLNLHSAWKTYVPGVFGSSFNSGWYNLPLTRLSTWAPGSQIMVNGFAWAGDYGVSAGGYGRALGYVSNVN